MRISNFNIIRQLKNQTPFLYQDDNSKIYYYQVEKNINLAYKKIKYNLKYYYSNTTNKLIIPFKVEENGGYRINISFTSTFHLKHFLLEISKWYGFKYFYLY